MGICFWVDGFMIGVLTERVEHGRWGEFFIPKGGHVSEVDFATHADEDHLKRTGSKKVELVCFFKSVEGADAAGELDAAEEGVDLGICP